MGPGHIGGGAWRAGNSRARRTRLAATNGQRRFRAIKALLGEEPLAAAVAEIDLDLEQHHLGLLAWGERGEEAARELASRLGRPLLVVAPLEQSWWGWISGGRPLGPSEERALGSFEPQVDAGPAFGLQEFGVRGFRATHRQAQRARMLTPPGLPALTRYADVAVEALATENEQEART